MEDKNNQFEEENNSREYAVKRIIKYSNEIEEKNKIALKSAIFAGLGATAILLLNHFLYSNVVNDVKDMILLAANWFGLGISGVETTVSSWLMLDALFEKTGLEISKRDLEDKYAITDQELNSQGRGR
ncbi:MAG: hypothetical protein K2J20_06255 [Bacilli bacterium]|nr:hypothetical protein [Bacilli bacterium]